MSSPALQVEDKTYAVLVCRDDAYGCPGYFVCNGSEKVKFNADNHGSNPTQQTLTLTLPPHKLILTNPEQIAVLTGI